MKKTFVLFIAIALIFSSFRFYGTVEFSPEVASRHKDSCILTYTGNAGFLINSGNHKILVDALFGPVDGDWCQQAGDSLNYLMQHGISPFDHIDALLITHNHIDHFNSSLTINFLKYNKNSVVICREQATKMMQPESGFSDISNRIISLRSDSLNDTLISFNNISIQAFRFPHSTYNVIDTITGKTHNRHSNIDNIVYIITMGKFSIMHSGDCATTSLQEFLHYKIQKRKFDIAVFNRMFLGREGMDIINTYIKSTMIVFMHIESEKVEYYNSIIKGFPTLQIVGKIMEKKVFLK